MRFNQHSLLKSHDMLMREQLGLFYVCINDKSPWYRAITHLRTIKLRRDTTMAQITTQATDTTNNVKDLKAYYLHTYTIFGAIICANNHKIHNLKHVFVIQQRACIPCTAAVVPDCEPPNLEKVTNSTLINRLIDISGD